MPLKGPSTLATLFNHMWPRIVADPSTLGRHVAATCVCNVCKRSVCGGDEPQPVVHLSHKLQCARQSLKIIVSYGNKYPRHNARPHVDEQSGQCARAQNLTRRSHDLKRLSQGLQSRQNAFKVTILNLFLMKYFRELWTSGIHIYH